MMKSIFFESNYIICQGERIFIDICINGCGSGCKYCYAEHNKEKQTLLDLEKIILICKYIKNKYGNVLRIITLCPNTEPLKSKESIELVLYIVKFFSEMSCSIQISTKEKIPAYFLEELNNIINKSKIYINISIPTLYNSRIIEPNAASIEERIANFDYIKKYNKINFCLYIKPYIPSNLDNYYIDIVNHYQISTVFIGPAFKIGIGVPCVSLYDTQNTSMIIKTQGDLIQKLMLILRKETKAMIFVSSICRIYNDVDSTCPLRLYDYCAEFCSNCKLACK